MTHNTTSNYRNTTKFDQPFDKAVDMALFDTLPQPVKDQLNDSWYKWSARSAQKMLDWGGIGYTVSNLRAHDLAAWQKDWPNYTAGPRGEMDELRVVSGSPARLAEAVSKAPADQVQLRRSRNHLRRARLHAARRRAAASRRLHAGTPVLLAF